MARPNLNPLGLTQGAFTVAGPTGLREIVIERRLTRILAFTGLTIDDVVNNPIAKNQVRGYFKLSKWMDRREEVVELERQWNATGRVRG